LGLGIAFSVMVLSTLVARLVFGVWYPCGMVHLLLCYFPFVILAIIVSFSFESAIPVIMGDTSMTIPSIQSQISFLAKIPPLHINPFALWIPIALYGLPASMVIVD
jgi:hypothetical protein